MAKQDKDAKSPGTSRATLIAMTVATFIGLAILLLQAARRLAMIFEAMG